MTHPTTPNDGDIHARAAQQPDVAARLAAPEAWRAKVEFSMTELTLQTNRAIEKIMAYVQDVADSVNSAIAAVMDRVEDHAHQTPAKPAESASNEIKSRGATGLPPSAERGSAWLTAAGRSHLGGIPPLGTIPTTLEVFGLPVATDPNIPDGVIEFRDTMTGAVLARIDTVIYKDVRMVVRPNDWRVR